MNTELPVPEAPENQVVVEEIVQQRLKAWKEYFRGISPRVLLVDSTHDKFLTLHQKALAYVKKRMRNEEYTVPTFPHESEIAFFVCLDSSLDTSCQKMEFTNLWIFTFGDRAFSPDHFQWDGDAEQNNWATTFSLGSYSKNLLTWKFISTLITRHIQDIQKQVPPAPNS